MSAPIREERQGWRDEALCGGRGKYDPELWFTPTAQARKVALEACGRCPALDDCTQFTLSTPAKFGIHAGMTHSQIVKKQRERREAA